LVFADSLEEFMFLDHIQLAMPTGEEAKARQFYGELLGLTEIKKPDALKARGGCWFQVGTQQLHLGVEAEFRPAKKAHPAFRVENYEALQKQLITNGFTVTPDNLLEHIDRFYTHDPFGNRLEFIKEKGS
jgi:catechol 2,3-dioxygenase-like lactoylglutathione lyase family enzyme